MKREVIEEKQKARWRGRNPQARLVFFEEDGLGDLKGELVDVRITYTGPWSMSGELVTTGTTSRPDTSIPLFVVA